MEKVEGGKGFIEISLQQKKIIQRVFEENKLFFGCIFNLFMKANWDCFSKMLQMESLITNIALKHNQIKLNQNEIISPIFH